MYEKRMNAHRAKTIADRPAFAGQTLRALSSALLLGLIGDRRVR
jgi:hypothetical protein